MPATCGACPGHDSPELSSAPRPSLIFPPPFPPLPLAAQKSKVKVTRFLNRLLGMTMADQELLFQV